MTYNTYWNLKRADGSIHEKHHYICFSQHLDRAFPTEVVFFEYDFHNTDCDEATMLKYFKFLKAIPEFSHLIEDPKRMAKTRKYELDLTKHNGLQVFTALTLVRAVVEIPEIAKTIAKMSARFKYSLPKQAILRALGSVYIENGHHWLTMTVHKDSLNKPLIAYGDLWNADSPARTTGLQRGIHGTFMYPDDGYGCRKFVDMDLINALLDEYKPRPKAVATATKSVPRSNMADNWAFV